MELKHITANVITTKLTRATLGTVRKMIKRNKSEKSRKIKRLKTCLWCCRLEIIGKKSKQRRHSKVSMRLFRRCTRDTRRKNVCNLIKVLFRESLRLYSQLRCNHSASVIQASPCYHPTFTTFLDRYSCRFLFFLFFLSLAVLSWFLVEDYCTWSFPLDARCTYVYILRYNYVGRGEFNNWRL